MRHFFVLIPHGMTPKPMPVNIAELTIGLLTKKNTITFKGTSQLQWNINLGFANFQILELGGQINYIKMKTEDESPKYDAYITGKFQFSKSLLMESELHLKANRDITLEVLVKNASQVKVDSVSNDLLKFNHSADPDHDSSSSSSHEHPSGTISFQDLLPSSTQSSLTSLTSAFINLNLTQSVFLLMGQVASLGSGFLLAGKFSSQQTHYGYTFGISLPQGFRFSQLLSALAPIDNVVQVKKANCIVISMQNVKVNDVVEKMNATKNSAIFPKDARFVFPFTGLKLDEATKNLSVSKGMSIYAEFDITSLHDDSIFHSVIQISSPEPPNIPTVAISAMISSNPMESEFRAHFEKLSLVGLLEFTNITLIYCPKSLVTFKLLGNIIIHLGAASYTFYGSFTLTKTDAVFSVTTDPSKQVIIHEPLGMFGISLNDARLSLRYDFPQNGKKSSSMEIKGSVKFYSSDSLNNTDRDLKLENVQSPESVLTLSGLVVFKDYSPVVVSIEISSTKPLTIADLVATIFKWRYNLGFLNIGFIGGHLYCATPPKGEPSVTINDLEYKSGYHISADTKIFDILFKIEASIPLDKSQLSITGSAHHPIEFGFAKFTGVKAHDKNSTEPDEAKSPQLTFITSSSSTSISIDIGLVLFSVPFATTNISYNLTKKVFTGKLTYNGSIGFIHNPSISIEWSKESGFKVTSFPMFGDFDFDLLDKLKKYKDSCGDLVGLAFKKAVQTRFNIDTNIGEPPKHEEFLAEIKITGTYDVLLAGKAKIASVPIPDLSLRIQREDDFSLKKLPQYILNFFKQNADRIVRQIINDPKRLGAILGILVLKSITKKAIQTLVCRNVKSDDIDPDKTDEDPTEDDFNDLDGAENNFEGLLEEFLGMIADAGADLIGLAGAAAGAELAADAALAILGGILGAIAAILAIFEISSYRKKKEKADKRKKKIEDKIKEIKEKMAAALDIKQPPSATFTPPNKLNVTWNPLTKHGASYHLVVTGTLLPLPGSVTSDTVTLFDKNIEQAQQEIETSKLYNAVDISVAVNPTLTVTKDGEIYSYKGKMYIVEVSNVHPTLHAPLHVSSTYEHDASRITATSSAVDYAKAYNFQLVEGNDRPYTVITHSTYTVPQDSKNTSISVSFDHSKIPSIATGPFKVRCRAIADSGSGIATSEYTYSTPLVLVPPCRNLSLVLSHFEDANQEIKLNWMLPQSTPQNSLGGFFCRVMHRKSNTVLLSYNVKKPASKASEPPHDIPTTHSFTIDSVVQAITSNNLISDPFTSIELEAQVNAVGTNNTEIDSVFIASAISSLKSPEHVGFNYSVKENALVISWKYTQETSTYGIEITDEKSTVMFSKKVSVNKDNSHPKDALEQVDPKVCIKVQYPDLSSVNDPTVNYSVQMTAVASGNENLDSLFPSKASNCLQVLNTPIEKSLQFNPHADCVDVRFNSVPDASGCYLFQLLKGSLVLANTTISKTITKDAPPLLSGSLSIDSFIDKLTGGDQVCGAVQAIGLGNFVSSSFAKFKSTLTVLQPPSNVTCHFSQREGAVTITCSQVKSVSEYLLGLSNSVNSNVVSLKASIHNNQVSIKISVSSVNKSDLLEWKVFAQSLGDPSHLSSPHSYLENKLHILPKPEVKQPSFDTKYEVLTLAWSPITNAASYGVVITAMKGNHELFTTCRRVLSTDSVQIVETKVSLTNADNWESILNELTSLSGHVLAIGANYYISSSPGLMPAIGRFDPPQNLHYTYVTESDCITLTCDAVENVLQYMFGFRSVTNPETFLRFPATVNKTDHKKVSTNLEGTDLRKANSREWIVFCKSTGDSTHFPSVEVSLGSNVKILDPPAINTFMYSVSDQILTLKWTSVEEASEYNVSIMYASIDNQNTSFVVPSPKSLTTTSLQIDMRQHVSNWSTIFDTVTSIVATVKAVGHGYLISRSSSRTIQRLESPQNIQVTSDDSNVVVTWSAVTSSTEYEAVVKVDGKHYVTKNVKENKLALPLDDLMKRFEDSAVYVVYVHVRVDITALNSTGLDLPSKPANFENDLQVKRIYQSNRFGGGGGSVFDDSITTHSPRIVGIKAISIRQSDRIHSIQVTYLLADGCTYDAPHHGGNDGEEKHIEFEPEEKIVKVFGTCMGYVNELTFVTKSVNGIERQHGPFGKTSGQPFQATGKVLGVFGSCGDLLDAVGFYMVSIPIDTKCSPLYGNDNGDSFDDWMEWQRTIRGQPPGFLLHIVGISGLQISYGTQINSIQATYLLEHGETTTSDIPQHGKSKGSKATIKFEAGEYITRVDGETNVEIIGHSTERPNLSRTLKRLSFATEKADGTVGNYTYGDSGNTSFSVYGQIISLLGCIAPDNTLGAIGFRYTGLPLKSIPTTDFFGEYKSDKFFDDIGQHNKPEIAGIKSIIIRHDKQVVSIQATYRRVDGSTWVAPSHGGSDGKESPVELDDGEKIIRVEGKTDDKGVRQLTFVKLKGDGSESKHGPYGEGGNKSFTVTGKILGFLGCSGNVLYSIAFFYIQ